MDIRCDTWFDGLRCRDGGGCGSLLLLELLLRLHPFLVHAHHLHLRAQVGHLFFVLRFQRFFVALGLARSDRSNGRDGLLNLWRSWCCHDGAAMLGIQLGTLCFGQGFVALCDRTTESARDNIQAETRPTDLEKGADLGWWLVYEQGRERVVGLRKHHARSVSQ